jgi:hypothetical protein
MIAAVVVLALYLMQKSKTNRYIKADSHLIFDKQEGKYIVPNKDNTIGWIEVPDPSL